MNKKLKTILQKVTTTPDQTDKQKKMHEIHISFTLKNL